MKFYYFLCHVDSKIVVFFLRLKNIKLVSFYLWYYILKTLVVKNNKMISLTSEIKVGVFAREFLGLKGYLTNKLLIDLLLLKRQDTVLCDYNLL